MPAGSISMFNDSHESSGPSAVHGDDQILLFVQKLSSNMFLVESPLRDCHDHSGIVGIGKSGSISTVCSSQEMLNVWTPASGQG